MGNERLGGEAHRPPLLLCHILAFHFPRPGLALGPEWSQSGHKAMVSNKRPHPHRHPPPRLCAWTQLLKVPSSQLSPGPDWGRRVMLDGCWKLRLLWEQEGWVPVGGVMGEGGGGGQAVSAIGSDGKG